MTCWQVLAGGLRMTELPADCFLPFQNHVVELDLSENGCVIRVMVGGDSNLNRLVAILLTTKVIGWCQHFKIHFPPFAGLLPSPAL